MKTVLYHCIQGGGTSDPYCSVRIGQAKETTETCEGTLNPKWEKGSMEFDVRSMREKDVSTCILIYKLFSVLVNF